ncbi:MAG TPA: ATP-binding cassette domain-containing protein [Micromonosporaceae bacterium]|jgi:ABC-2 type transport system ATP-binding protein
MSPVIEITELRKQYRRRGRAHPALSGFDMVVEAGEVHGFLGPNGSGKTTTLRTLLGLVRADDGAMSLLGRSVPRALPDVVGRVGAIVEAPQFFLHFSGRRTLDLLAMAGGVDRKRIDEVLDLVGLTDRAGDRVKTYSLGMKQRLAVASALLKRPDLLILDEPANGLDPAGIREMRDLMRRLAGDGVTVVLSSHILGEVQQICDSVTIIARGRRVTHGPVADVLAASDRGEYRIRAADNERAAEVLRQAGAAVRAADDHLLISHITDPAWITETLGCAGVWLTELTAVRPDLEHVFLELTGAQS